MKVGPNLFAVKVGPNLFAVKVGPNLFAVKVGPNLFAVKVGPNLFAVTVGPNLFAVKFLLQFFIFYSTYFGLRSFVEKFHDVHRPNMLPQCLIDRLETFLGSRLFADASGHFIFVSMSNLLIFFWQISDGPHNVRPNNK